MKASEFTLRKQKQGDEEKSSEILCLNDLEQQHIVEEHPESAEYAIDILEFSTE